MSAVDAPPVTNAPPITSTSPVTSTAILRFLRVTLHVGFAVLLAVGVSRLLLEAGERPSRYVYFGLSVALALVYLVGTVAEKRFSAGRLQKNPRRWAVLWLGLITVMWAVLMFGSVEFSWLVFPLFFLHLHLLPRWAGIGMVSVMTAGVILAQWASSGADFPPLPVVLGPVFGMAFSIATAKAYKLLYQEGEAQRHAAEELRRTRAELASTQHEAGVLAERARLAREIHDTLAQGFSSIILVSRAARRSLDSGDLESAGESLTMVEATAAENLAEARNFVRGLSSPALAQTSLVEALSRLCSKTEREAAARGGQLACSFRLDGEPVEIPQPYKVTLFRAATTSLANVWLHAHATSAVVSLAFLGSEVTLDVYDDGRGFDPDILPGAVAGRADGSGFGLRSLRERVVVQGGTLALETAPGEGTVVAIRLPLGAGVDTGFNAGLGTELGIGLSSRQGDSNG
ncbi:sensor histidine kinase [Arthrobacter psychrochitiniphilus]|uniref:Oxygen sensor histidine kinase NreB n=1 Tax=Arthrobacter psychrochitiniphilus TaxID=291045 RepID=A0A2V3DRT8_9MICC|nr:sensor histidine kinase [Arthrobacter psychrochitiniphilus]NYG19194.1 signal transduction histidine kinase [Arthrobacter psychrochitiniphilus]PXA65860.1 sensor histidine kinase [Arthrobacter psychrochitiniphilus]